MDRPSSALFQVFLRLRPSHVERERFLHVERATLDHEPTHITIKPPSDDKRKRAVERFGFTRVFEEGAGQLDLFRDAGAVSMIEGVLGARGREGRDGLLATLGVTGSGKVWDYIDDRYAICRTDHPSIEPHHSGRQVPARPHPARLGHPLPPHRTLSCEPRCPFRRIPVSRRCRR